MSDEDDVHRYRATCRWKGSTGAGYDSYVRAHEVVCAPADDVLHLSSDPAFLGDPSLLNPEQLMVAAASSCQLLSFLAVAARARVEVASYVDDAEAEMPERGDPMSIERIMLRPHIVVRPGTSVTRLRHLVEVAHRECYIANSLRTEVIVTPTFETRDAYSFRDGDTAATHRAIAARIFDSPSRVRCSRYLRLAGSAPRCRRPRLWAWSLHQTPRRGQRRPTHDRSRHLGAFPRARPLGRHSERRLRAA